MQATDENRLETWMETTGTTSDGAQWFEDEDFWRTTFDQMFPAWRMENAPREVEEILALTGVTGGRALDLCCGPGRHSCALARAGFAVTAVDRTRYLLDLARRRSADQGLEIEFVECDMRDLDAGTDFDLAINLFTSFGYLDDDTENQAVLERLHASLKPGGRLVLDVRGKENVARSFLPARFEALDGGGYFAQHNAVEDDWGRLRTTWFYLRDGRYRQFELVHHLYSGRQLREMLIEAGFAAVDLFGDFAGSPFGVDSPRLVAVATR